MNTPIARVSFRRSSRDVRSRAGAGAAGGGGFALGADAGAGGGDEVAGRGACGLGAPAAGPAPASLPPVFRGPVAGFGFVEVIPWELESLELVLCEPGVGLDPDPSGRAGEGVCAAGAVVASPVLAASDPCDGFCCSAGGGADAGGLDWL